MKRVGIVAFVVMAILAAVCAVPAPAGADKFAKIHWGTNSVTLVVPTPSPACRTTHGTISCRWALLVTQGDANTIVGAAAGTSGVLTVAYPTTCGVIHASAIVGPPIRREIGYAHTISQPCTPAPPVALSAAAATEVANNTSGVAAPLVPTGATSTGSSTSTPASATPSALAFTGAPILDFLVGGFACLLLSAWCLLPVGLRYRRYRRYLRQ